jgi:general secretion pathway protein M
VSILAAQRKAIVSSPLMATAIYVGLIVLLLFAVVTSIADLIDQRSEVDASATMLHQLEGNRATKGGAAGDVTMPSGSAYLEGATVTIAGASLLQRVASAVVKFGGNVLSTQLDVQSTSSKPGFLSMITLTTASGSQPGKLRVLLAVSGQWRGAK